MARIKYYYDTETCRYERIKVSTWDIILNFLGFVAVSMILAVVIYGVYGIYFDSPKEALLKKTNNELGYHYEILEKKVSTMEEMMANLEERDDNIYRTIFEAEPIPDPVRRAGIGGSDRYDELRRGNLEREDLILETYQKIDAMSRKMVIQAESYDELLNLARQKSKMLAAIPAIQPINNKELTRLASGYGMRIHPIYKARRMHWGLDFAAPRGTPIYATGDGKVVLAKTSYTKTGYGNQVEIDHGFGYRTKYAHMQTFVVKVGDQVKRGQLIGYVGSTGGSTAPHVHYEIIKDNQKVDPIQYIIQDVTDEEYQKLLELASRENQSLG
ncbi:MAG: peptidoglycan DD-metalloendopeptidase family protein [Bacteroidota bacterium]